MMSSRLVCVVHLSPAEVFYSQEYQQGVIQRLGISTVKHVVVHQDTSCDHRLLKASLAHQVKIFYNSLMILCEAFFIIILIRLILLSPFCL